MITSDRTARFGELLWQTGVYAVTDDTLDFDVLNRKVSALLEAGVRLFQYRDKHRSDSESYDAASRLAALIHAADGMLIVNDRVDLALAVGADGAHLGQDDLPLPIAREMLGPDHILGASASYLPEIPAAIAAGIDYLGFGAVYLTGTKPDAEYAGLDNLRQACLASTVPVVGIGGISAERAPFVCQQGVAGVAVVSALFSADDAAVAARHLLNLVGRARLPRV